MINQVNLRAARENANMTVVEVAKKFKRCQSWLTHIETNKRGIEARDLQKLVAIYGLTMNDIFLPELTTKSGIKNTKNRTRK